MRTVRGACTLASLLGVTCPHCGSPTPLALSDPESVRCQACGTTSATPGAARERLREAAALLEKLDARERQLSGIQRFAFADSYERMMLVALVLIIGVAAFELLATAAQAANRSIGPESSFEDWLHVLAPAVGLIVCVATAALALVPLRIARARLARTFAADPPREAGSSGSCHVCGGPLKQPGARSPIVRCGFCQADNLVSSDLVHRVARTRKLVLDAHEKTSRVQRRWLEAVTIAYGIGLAWLLPAIALTSHFGFIRAAQAVEQALIDELPPDDSVRYVLIGGCVQAADSGSRSDRTFAARRLVGLLVHLRGGRQPIGPSVVSVYRRSDGPGCFALVRNRSGDQARVSISDLCITDPPSDLYGP